MKRSPMRDILSLYLLSRLTLVIITYFGFILMTHAKYSRRAVEFTTFVQAWQRWDADNYTFISIHGYIPERPFHPAFFPLYPLMIRTFNALSNLHDPILSGMILSNIAFLAALFVLYTLASEEQGDEAARRTLLYLCLFPTSFYFFTSYTESLFLLLSAGTLLALRHQQWLFAGVLGLCAALTRNVGVLLLLPYLCEVYSMYRESSPEIAGWFKKGVQLLGQMLPGLLIPLGLGLYAYYCWQLSGDPLRFATVQSHWGRHTSWFLEGFWRTLFEIFWFQPFASSATAHDLLDLSATLGFVGLAIVGWRRLRASYTLWIALLLVTMLVSSATTAPADPLQSNQRFVLVMFPGFITLATLGIQYPRLHQTLLFLFPSLLAVLTLLFLMNRWMV